MLGSGFCNETSVFPGTMELWLDVCEGADVFEICWGVCVDSSKGTIGRWMVAFLLPQPRPLPLVGGGRGAELQTPVGVRGGESAWKEREIRIKYCNVYNHLNFN